MRAFQTAALAKVTAAGVSRVYKPNEVPPNPGAPYCVVFVSFEGAERYTLEAAHSVGVVRVTTQSFGTADGALDTDAKARSGLLDQRLTVAGHDVGPGELQVGGRTVGSSMTRDPDTDGLVGLMSTYLFAFTKES